MDNNQKIQFTKIRDEENRKIKSVLWNLSANGEEPHIGNF